MWPPTHSIAAVPTTVSAVSSFGIASTSPRPKRATPTRGSSARRSPTSSIFTIRPTKPYTSTVMAIATTVRITALNTNGSSATSFREITMISADRMKSVRTAPDTTVSSSGRAASPAAWAS